MDICKVLTGFNPISPSEFDLSEKALSSGSLPDPSLFFTWYCEKAREIEKYTGSVEFSLELLDLALGNLPSNARIAKRFILATRHSLLRYNAHINSLATKLEDETLSAEGKASILQSLRTIDLKTFEMSSKKSTTDSKDETSTKQFNDETKKEEYENYQNEDWSAEIEILDLILQSRFDEAFDQAQQSVFFPAALIDKYSSNPMEWLEIYCRTLHQECEKYFESIDNYDSIQIIPPSQCNDPWSEIVNAYLGSDIQTSYTEEQKMYVILTKSKMAQSLLKMPKTNADKFEDENESYF